MSAARVIARIDLEAIEHNLREVHKKVLDSKIMPVIKANGYGHGAVAIARKVQDLPFIGGFAIATIEEAYELLDSGISKPLLILGYVPEESLPELIKHDIRTAVFEKKTADILSCEALKQNKIARIHIKVDTGMSRLGIAPDDKGIDYIRYISNLPGIKIEGIFTHFARADEEDKDNAKAVLERFETFVNRAVDECGVSFDIVHCANSAAIIRINGSSKTMVRSGIITYGLWPSDVVEKEREIDLRPAMSLESAVVYLKDIPENTPVSYGGLYVSDSVRRIATIPVGYADGYPRSLSNKGHVLIRGKKAPIRGRVCMDYLMADVTDIPEVTVGDKVTLIGRDGEENISAELLGDLSGRFNYELVCCISPRVPRLYS